VRSLLRAVALTLYVAGAVNAQDLDSSRRTAIVRAAERVAPAVVSVNVRSTQRVQPRSIFDMFGPSTREVQGLGSGFVFRDDGIVVTNEHVVRNATEVVITFSDGRDFEASVVGTDEVTDLAVLRIKNPPRDLPVAPLSSSSGLIIGEWAIAIGNPFGYYLANPEPTVTAGVISAVGRNIIPTGGDSRGIYLDMIQTDASINPGNSGGPLINAVGEVIGVNSSILSQSGGSVGLGFAIPIDRARRIVNDLLTEGRVRRVFTGMSVQPTSPNRFGRSHEVEIADVAEGTPAARAGLERGDIIESVNGRTVANQLDWEARLLDARVNQNLTIVARRGETRRTFLVTPTNLPSLGAERTNALAGLQLVTLTPGIRVERNLTSEQGALIVGLSADARAIGLNEGDLIVEINRQPVRTAEEAAALMRELAGRATIRLGVEREGRYGSFAFNIRG
jgi:serine protease Do